MLPQPPSTILSSPLPPLPASWSALSWRQLCDCWDVKMRYGGNADVARVAALLALLEMKPVGIPASRHPGIPTDRYDETTGEAVYLLRRVDGPLWTVTPRELSQMAQQALPWFQYPYGDPGEPVVKDEKGTVIKEPRDPVRGYVNPNWRGDAMQLPEETIVVVDNRIIAGSEWRKQTPESLHFSLPQVACYNITWQQYRSLQSIAPQLFQDGVSDDDVLDMQAQFMAHCLVPARQPAANADNFAPPHDFTYDMGRAEQTVAFWRERLEYQNTGIPAYQNTAGILFNLCFQVYQTALSYYAQVFPTLFNGSGKSDPLQDALTGEVNTINAVMKYQHYTKPEDVYAESLPVILSTLNTMSEEAKQIEQMNSRIKRKK